MGKIVTNFFDGSCLDYDRGSQDDWCVYLKRPNSPRYAPKDCQYFKRLYEYSMTHGTQKVYEDFLQVYNRTTKVCSEEVFDMIKEIAKGYGNDELNFAIDLSIIYMGMIAEENKKNTRLGKRIKRLGIHQTLVEGMSYDKAAEFSYGMGWRKIDEICKSKGF